MTGYVQITKWEYYGQLAVPTGQVRDTPQGREAEFIQITGRHPERKVWLRKEEIAFPTTTTSSTSNPRR
jgi:hypothetical protein